MTNKILYWLPRILAIFAILLMMMFSFDVFSGEGSIGKKLLGFLAHNIPVFILIIVLVIAWKYEVIGGAIFIVLSVAMAIYFKAFSGNAGSLAIVSPFFLTGVLFILHQLLKGKEKQE
ncbi:MAG: hypothetical protein MUF36_04985 [Bacteroidales bacterium]|jgi:hypothetical protein|nr:hypothetical protein [Bacteroidales bacterium]